MNTTKLTIKDSSLSFLLGFLLCQLGVVVSTCLALFIYKFCGFDIAYFESFSTSGIGYLISAISLYLVMLLVFLYFNHKKERGDSNVQYRFKPASSIQCKKDFLQIKKKERLK